MGSSNFGRAWIEFDVERRARVQGEGLRLDLRAEFGAEFGLEVGTRWSTRTSTTGGTADKGGERGHVAAQVDL